jgi:hypothetical protein
MMAAMGFNRLVWAWTGGLKKALVWDCGPRARRRSAQS